MVCLACSASSRGFIDDDGGDATTSGATCTDGTKNGPESDVDCGGGLGACPSCGDGKKCNSAADCSSGVCSGGTCQTPSCTDGIKNGKETATDCGGGVCPKCAVCIQCKEDADCDTTVCGSMGLCAPTITITSAIYAANCGAPTPVPTIAQACDNKQSCNYTFWYAKDLGYDPAYGCVKDLSVEYKCSGGTTTHKFYDACAPCEQNPMKTTFTLGLDCPACLGVGQPPN